MAVEFQKVLAAWASAHTPHPVNLFASELCNVIYQLISEFVLLNYVSISKRGWWESLLRVKDSLNHVGIWRWDGWGTKSSDCRPMQCPGRQFEDRIT